MTAEFEVALLRIKSNWILAFFIAALCFGLLGTVFLLVPRRPAEMVLGTPNTFRFTFDPHLLLIIEEMSHRPGPSGSSIRATLVASNTAAADMLIDLSDLRLAVIAADRSELDPVMPAWENDPDGSAALSPRTSRTARVELPLPETFEPAAILIWEDNRLLRLLPAARGSILCPTLRLSLDEEDGVGALPDGAGKTPRE